MLNRRSFLKRMGGVVFGIAAASAIKLEMVKEEVISAPLPRSVKLRRDPEKQKPIAIVQELTTGYIETIRRENALLITRTEGTGIGANWRPL
jgi:hypothetical protein